MTRSPIADAAAGKGASFFRAIDAETAIARQRLIDAFDRLDRGGDVIGILPACDAAALLVATGRRIARAGLTAAIADYLAVARHEPASMFCVAQNGGRRAADGTNISIGDELDAFGGRLSRGREPVRLFGFIFAIERTRHRLFTSKSATFASGRTPGSMAVVAPGHPTLARRLVALIDAVAGNASDRALVIAQAHATYEAIDHIVRAWPATRPPATDVDPRVPRLVAGL